MKRIRFLFVLAVLALSVQLAAAPDVAAVPDLTISGFVDTRASLVGGGEDTFLLDSYRVIFGAKIAPWLSAVIHVAGTGSGTPISVPTATITASTESSGTRYSIAIGRSPVPFGLASGWYISPNNAFAYDPAVTAKGLGGKWSDIGITGTVAGDAFSVQAYLVQGNLALVKGAGTGYDEGLAAGLRAVFTPLEGLKLGLSYALNAHGADLDTSNNPIDVPNTSLVAGDVSWALGPALLSFQYTASMPKFEFDARKDVWFGQFEFDLANILGIPITPGVRFDYITKSITGGDAENALTIQAAYKFEKYLRLGLSFRTATGADDALLLQVLGMF